MKKIIFIFPVLFFAFFLELAFGTLAAVEGVRPPIIVFITLSCYWFLSFSARTALAFMVGIFMDSTLLSPAGTYLSLFVLFAFAVEEMKHIFFAPISLRLLAAMTGGFLFLFLNFVQPFGAFFGWVHGGSYVLRSPVLLNAFIGSFFWTCAFSLILFAAFTIHAVFLKDKR
ncbi:MAG: rod shape-determining protein MreD [Candidatus Colwellbacteria bacterium]|nr:rod shape-determining protein MreD [Candidatus Colwellbacteria bacterium]